MRDERRQCVRIGAAADGDPDLEDLLSAETSEPLAQDANQLLRAAVGGDVSGGAISFSGGGNLINLVYGDGSAQLELSVGGDLEIIGGGNPHTSSTTGSWNDFGREMAELGREMGQLGQELSREFKEAFSQAGWPLGPNFGNDIARKAQERARKAQRKAEERARHAEERGRHAGERANRMRVRINSREWQLDPERLERIKEQARRAATEGVSGALEAVERAVRNLRVPTPPTPPPPTYTGPGVPPTPPTGSGTPPPPPPFPSGGAPQTPTPPVPPQSFTNQATSGEAQVQHEQPAQQQSSDTAEYAPEASATTLEQEREAILRMIAEGRISPEEGDMLLEGLGS